MKKITIILAFMLCLTPVFAQKHSVVLGNVSGSESQQWVMMLKSSILQGLTSTGRIDVIDGQSVSGLSANTAEALVQLKSTGAEYLLEAQLESINVESDYINNKTLYKAKTQYAYQLYSIADGSTVYSNRDYHYGNSTQDRNAAITDSFGLVDNEIVSMVNNVFRVTGEIKAINETHPKKGIVSVYLGAGANDGVAKGNIFEIFKIMDVAGEKITEKIGEMKVEEVKTGSLSLCKVTKGGKELQDCLDNEIPVQVTSRPPKDVLGGINSVLKSL